MKRLLLFVGAALGCLLMFVVALGVYVVMCADISVTQNSTLPSGRTVALEVHGWQSYSSQDAGNSTSIRLGRHQIVVAPTQVVVDNQVVAMISADAKAVAIKSLKDEISFTADGVPIATVRR